MSFLEVPVDEIGVPDGRALKASSNFLRACAQHPTRVISSTLLYPAYPSRGFILDINIFN